MKTGNQRAGGSQQAGATPQLQRGQGFSGVPATPTPHLAIVRDKKAPSRSWGWGPSKSTRGLEIKGSPLPRAPPTPRDPRAPPTHVLHVAGRDGLPVAVDGALGDDDDVQSGPSAPSLGQRRGSAQPPARRPRPRHGRDCKPSPGPRRGAHGAMGGLRRVNQDPAAPPGGRDWATGGLLLPLPLPGLREDSLHQLVMNE